MAKRGSGITKAAKVRAAKQRLADAHAVRPVVSYHARVARIEAAGKRARETGARWCILQTTGNRTLSLARSLAAAGFEVWTPTDLRTFRETRARIRVQREVALMPTFVFARADTREHIADMFRAHALPAAHPPFRIFHRAGEVPTIKESTLAKLRDAEAAMARALLKTERHSFAAGEAVRVDTDAFTGLPAIVLTCNGKRAKLDIGGPFPLNVATWQLLPDAVSGRSSPEDMAARAA